jgi:methylamine dehydrogenase accessory protein MauD
VVLWILTVSMFVVLLVVLRQLGLIYVRGGGAPQVEQGPPVGATVPEFDGVADVTGAPFRFPDPQRSLNLVVFTSPSCRICADVIRGVPGIARDQDVRVLVISEASVEANESLRDEAAGATFVTDGTRQKILAVGSHPFALVADGDGTILDKGAVNGPGDLQVLLERAERAYRDAHASSGASMDGR